jgi:hypothetical protein
MLRSIALVVLTCLSVSCASSADRAKTGLDQAGKELGTAGSDAKKNVDYGTKDAKKETGADQKKK